MSVVGRTSVPPLPKPDSGRFIDAYTRGLTTTEIAKAFLVPEATVA